MTSCKVHNVRFYKPVPRAIHCVAYEAKYKKLALSRSDGSIEIWDLSYTPHIERTIPAMPGASVENLAWCKERLFSTGLHGMITEYNLITLQTKYESPLTSGPGWCLDINRKKTKLAAGTEDGYINIFEIEDDSLTYLKILDKQEGRILCLSWHGSGEVIVTGSSDSVRVWNVHSGHALYRMTTGRTESNRETVVWCVAITDDFTVISGDSRGCICFWDGQKGTQIQKVQSHKADILSLAITDDQDTVYCAGVDPLIASFARVKAREGQTGRTKWVRSIDRRVHENDVRALLSTGENKLYSGGVDGYLAFSSYPPKQLSKYPPILQHPCVTVCPPSRCILLRYTSHLEVWRLGKSVSITSAQGFLPLQQDCIKLLQLTSRNNEPIVCCSLSHDSRWLAYSTPTIVRFFSFSMEGDDGRPYVEKLNGFGTECGPAHNIVFSPNNKFAVVASNSRDLFIVQMSEDGPVVVKTFKTHAVLKDIVHLMTFSPDGQFLVTADHRSNIAVWRTSSWEHYCSLPKLKCAPTAMAVQGGTDLLVVVYADHKIVEFSLKPKEKKYTTFSRRLDDNHPKQWLSRNFTVTNVAFDPRNDDIIIMHDDNTICIINKNKKLPKCDAKIPRLDTASSDSQSHDSCHAYPQTSKPESAFHVIKKYKHLVHFGWLDEDEMVAVEVTPLSLEEQLPPSLKQKRFGLQ